MVGIGLLLSIIGITTVRRLNKPRLRIIALPSLVLLYSFTMFAFVFGNALADQNRYADFRIEAVVNDLARVYTSTERVSETTLQVQGDIGASVVMRQVRKQYPVVSRIFNQIFWSKNENRYWNWGARKIVRYYNRNQKWFRKGEFELNPDNMPVVIDTYYHTISADDNGNVCVVFK
jgi:uncharacterized protein YejL (UPF0352 family)